jgi:hypothetical protein
MYTREAKRQRALGGVHARLHEKHVCHIQLPGLVLATELCALSKYPLDLTDEPYTGEQSHDRMSVIATVP